jgi:hypothetical protein
MSDAGAAAHNGSATPRAVAGAPGQPAPGSGTAGSPAAGAASDAGAPSQNSGGAGSAGCMDGSMQSCVAGMGICATGMQRCANGGWGACKAQQAPQKEQCDGQPIDEDCDGDPDNGCSCMDGQTRACPNGKSMGACTPGTQQCVAGQWSSACTGRKDPSSEVCDGKDNDCDGQSDADQAGVCTGGKPCLQSGGTWQCAQCTKATLANDCPAPDGCKIASCSDAGQCSVQSAADLTVCPRAGTWEGYCRTGTCTEAISADGHSHMGPGEELRPGQALTLGNGNIQFLYQTDGNLVLWTDFANREFTYSQASAARQAGALIMQPDGNLVIWLGEGKSLWTSGTGNQPGNTLVLSGSTKDDIKARIVSKAGATLWQVP